MPHRTRHLAVALALAAGLGAHAAHAETTIVIDAPDVQKLRTVDEGFRATELIGMDVYSNAGKRIGEVEDFVVARGGYLYALIDVEDGPLGDILDLGEDETVVVPWDQLRTRARD